MIQAVKTQEDGGIGGGVMPNRYSVRFDEPGRRTTEFLSKDIVGPGFKHVSQVQLEAGQPVFVTHNQREMKGKVVRHDFESQDVILQINENETLLKKIEDIRLLESRKSARLVNSDTDFSKLADVNISGNGGSGGYGSGNSSSGSGSGNLSSGGSSFHQTDRRKFAAASARGSGAIAVPNHRSDYVQIAGSRKRRTSENIMDDEETMTECSAAMLLMKLSCSPMTSSPNSLLLAAAAQAAAAAAQNDNRPPSADSSSGASSFRSSTPSPPLSSSAATDEGIVKDMDRSGRVLYQCTYRGCGEHHCSVRSIEAHVRKEHLLKEDPDRLLEEGEEEFYYNEIEAEDSITSKLLPQQLLLQQQQQQYQAHYFPIRARSYSSSSASSSVSQLASLSLVDHLDMARPAHEDPGRGAIAQRSILVHQKQPATTTGTSSLITMRTTRDTNNAISMPITIAPSAHGSPGKYILISPPNHRTAPVDSSAAMSAPSPVAAFPASAPSSSLAAGNLIKSPTRRVREGKKCRKVYGLEQRDLWCTQCKWKKACARFGTASSSSHATSSSQNQQPVAAAAHTSSSLLSTSSPAGSLLMAVSPSVGGARNVMIGAGAARAIKF